MKNYSSPKGFTVLELLVVIAIMCILMALVLVGLNAAQSSSADQQAISNVQSVAVGLEQFHDVCGVYPGTLTGTETCPALATNTGAKTLADFIPEIAGYDFDGFNGKPSDYAYAGRAQSSSPGSPCVGFHMGVKLRTNSAFAVSSSRFDSTSSGPGFPVCTDPTTKNPGNTFDNHLDKANPNVVKYFDIKK